MSMPYPLARDFNAHDVRFDPDDSRPNYIGLNQENGAAITASTWEIFQFTYTTTTSSDVARIRRTTGIWDNRASLFP